MNKTIQEVYIRAARDSGFRMDSIEVAKFVATLMNKSPFEVYLAFPCMETMGRVANGTHPSVRK